MDISWNKGLTLIKKQAGVNIKLETVDLFDYIMNSEDQNNLKANVEQLIRKEIKSIYGDDYGWEVQWLYFPIPQAKYVARKASLIEVSVDLYIAASIDVELEYESDRLELVKPLRKGVEKLKLPVVFLDVIARGDVGRSEEFKVVEKGKDYTTFDIPGCGEFKVPDEFISAWRDFSLRRFMAKREDDTGAALVEIGLLSPEQGRLINSALSEPAKEMMMVEVGDKEEIIEGLRSLGLSKAVSLQLYEGAKPHFSPGASAEDKIRACLKFHGGRQVK